MNEYPSMVQIASHRPEDHCHAEERGKTGAAEISATAEGRKAVSAAADHGLRKHLMVFSTDGDRRTFRLTLTHGISGFVHTQPWPGV
jgi:hypothetical protein